MRILYQLRSSAGTIVRRSVRRQAHSFLAQTADCRASQRNVLTRLLALNADSRFSGERKLGRVRSVAEFRKQMPVADYDVFAPYIEQVKKGDHSALLGSRNELLMFSLSSGTTSQSKYIPITRQFLADYRRGWQVWGICALDDHPAVNSRQIVQLSSDYDRFRTEGGTPCGNISGLATAMQRPIVRLMYTVPGVVSKISSPEAKTYTAMRLAVADANVGMIITANPSTLIQLAQLADSQKETLIRDIADGKLSKRYDVDNSVRRDLHRRIACRRKGRARQLERIVEMTGQLSPRDYWDGLHLAAVWTGGSAGAYLHSLRRWYGRVPVRDHGLSASEGRMTIPLSDEGSAGVLDVGTHFFEFIPEAEHDSENPTVLEAHELREGENYFILLTTSSGLYRYDICDVVRCVGFYQTTPMLEFLHKGAHISNVTGEKISESQVVAAVRRCVERLEIDLKHFTVSPVWGEPPRYQLLAEAHDVASPSVAKGLVENVDKQLQELNCEYREKRQSGRLATITWLPLPEGTWSKFARERQQGIGGSLEQYKHPCLVPDLEFSTRIVSEFTSLNGSSSPQPALSKLERR